MPKEINGYESQQLKNYGIDEISSGRKLDPNISPETTKKQRVHQKISLGQRPSIVVNQVKAKLQKLNITKLKQTIKVPSYNKLSYNIFFTLTVILGFTCIFFLTSGKGQSISKSMIDEHFLLDTDTTIYKKWAESETPAKLDIYFFNITNPDDVLYSGDPVTVKESGPYSFSITNRKDLDSIKKVSFQNVDAFAYTGTLEVKNISDKSEFDKKITTMNLVYLELESQLKGQNFDKNIAGVKYDETFMNNIRVGDLLFGYDSHQFIEKNHRVFPYTNGEKVKKFMVRAGDKNKINETIDEQFQTLMYSENTGFNCWFKMYENPVTNDEFRGTDGTVFAPYSIDILGQKNIPIINNNYKRVLNFSRSASQYYKGMVPTITLEEVPTEEKMFKKNFCTDDYYCYVDNYHIPKCMGYNLPMSISKPHFYGMDEKFHSSIRGLKPSKRKHTNRIIVEPKTGVMLEFKSVFQRNIGLNRRMKDIDPEFENLHEDLIYVPFAWFDLTVKIDDIGLALQLVALVFILPNLWVVFFVLMVLCMTVGICQRFQDQKLTAKMQLEAQIELNEIEDIITKKGHKKSNVEILPRKRNYLSN